jgi:hypothetical protein
MQRSQFHIKLLRKIKKKKRSYFPLFSVQLLDRVDDSQIDPENVFAGNKKRQKLIFKIDRFFASFLLRQMERGAINSFASKLHFK